PDGADRTELWHTRLGEDTGQRVDETRATLRAIWSVEPAALPFVTTLNADDRRRLMDQTANFTRFDGDPPAISARRLMLSSLGAFTDLHYLAAAPAGFPDPWIT